MKVQYKLFILIFAIVFISACSSPNYDIVDNTVVMDDSNVYLKVSPAVLSGSGWVETEFVSKQYSGNIDFVFGFNRTDAIPTQAQIYHPRNITEVLNFTCPTTDFTYTLNPNTLYCWNPTNMSTLYNGSFNTGNIATRTITYNQTYQSDWRTWNPDGHIDRDYEGMTRWYYATNEPVVEDVTYKLRFYLSVPDGSSGKYSLALKPSSETIDQAITNGHFYMLDPWWTSVINGVTDYYTFDNTYKSNLSNRNFTGNYYGFATGRNAGNVSIYSTNGAEGGINLIQTTGGVGTFALTGDETTSFSIVTWIKANNPRSGVNSYLLSTRSSTNNFAISMSSHYENPTRDLRFNVWKIDGTGVSLIIPYTSNTWVMWTVTYNGSNQVINSYLNRSILLDSDTYNGGDAGNIDGQLWNLFANDDSPSYINIDELYFFDYTLDSSEIENIYDYGLPNPDSILVSIAVNASMHPTFVGINNQIICNGTVNNLLDDSNINVTITSYKNGILNGTESFNDQNSPYTFTSSNSLFPLNYTIGDVWNCTVDAVDANDTSVNGTTSSIVTVQNSPPSFTHGDINITMNYKDTNTIQFNCTDVDIQDLNYSITNLTTDFVTPLTINLTTGLVNITGLNILDTGNHLFNVTCNDSITLASVLLNTTITNTAPSIPSTLSPPTLTFTQDSSSILTCSGSTDTEGETVYYEFWGNTTGVAATLWQNTTGTTYTLPLGSNATYYWGCRAYDTNAWSDFTSNRTITKFAVFGCANQPSPFINFSFKDEQSLANINGSIVIDSTFTVNGKDDEFSVSYTNSTEYPAYGICANPQDMTIDFDLSLTYGSVGGAVTYNPRTLTMTLANTTNATTQRVLYLLDVLNGREVNFHLSNSAGTAISGVDTKVERKIGGTWTEISHDSTDASGTEQFFLDSSITHRFTFIKTGYATFVYETKPSQPDYYINLESQTSTVLYTPKLGGMNWMLRPLKGILSSNATQIFSWTVNQSISAVSNETLTGCKLLLYTGNKTTLLGNSSSNATDGQITYLSGYVQGTYNYTGKNCYVSISLTPPASIYGFAYISLANKTFEDGSQWYLVESGLWWNSLPSNPSGNTIKDILADFMQLQELSENEQSAVASNMMWFFLITVLLIGLIGFYSGIELQSPGINIWAVFIIVFIASFGGWFNFHQTVSDSVWAVAFWNQWWLTFTTGLIAFGFTLNSWANRRGGM